MTSSRAYNYDPDHSFRSFISIHSRVTNINPLLSPLHLPPPLRRSYDCYKIKTARPQVKVYKFCHVYTTYPKKDLHTV